MKKELIIILIFLSFFAFSCISVSAQDEDPPEFTYIFPDVNEITNSRTPEIIIEFTDESLIDRGSLVLIIDGDDVSDWDETSINETTVVHEIPAILPLDNGNHSVFIELADINGNVATKEWEFIVNIYYNPPSELIDIQTLIFYVFIGTAIVAIVVVAYIVYLKQTKKFTFRKYFAQKPHHKEYYTLYLPFLFAFFFLIIALSFVMGRGDITPYAVEYIFVIAFFIGAIPYVIRTQIEKRKILKYERGFAQFLFEMADAMRGGLDPSKAIIELSKTDTGILSESLKVAAQSIKIGRAFDEVIVNIVRPFKSELAVRYAKLIAEASKIGGETSQVIHRAAKDMDDFIKINQDRKRQLTMQTTTIYMSFAVLLVAIYMLLTFFPSMEGINISILTSTDLEAAEAAGAVTRMDFTTLLRRFFHIVLINSVGTGMIIGEIMEGKIKYGLLHSIIMVAVSVIFFVVLLF